MDMKLESAIKERIQDRFDILHALYDIWFTENPISIVPKDKCYPPSHIERQRTMTYLVDKGLIIVRPVEHEPEMVELCITVNGIDFYEQGRLEGKGDGWSVVREYTN
ncbi:hypothetical protein [Paenibacillus tundrae]